LGHTVEEETLDINIENTLDELSYVKRILDVNENKENGETEYLYVVLTVVENLESSDDLLTLFKIYARHFDFDIQ
jgi:hypothetical protein